MPFDLIKTKTVAILLSVCIIEPIIHRTTSASPIPIIKDLHVTTIFFATDIHGSDICWSKFLNAGKFYNADQLILGGDMTGKAVVPFVHMGGTNYRITLLEQVFDVSTEDELTDMKKRVRSRGYYPYLTTPMKLPNWRKTQTASARYFSLKCSRSSSNGWIWPIKNWQAQA
jgi:hypothetical protein